MQNSDVRFYVMKEQCNQCLFTSNRLVSGKRMKEIVDDCLSKDTHFICHKATLADNRNVCCRGYFDRFKRDVLEIRLAYYLGIVEEVAEEDLAKLGARSEVETG